MASGGCFVIVREDGFFWTGRGWSVDVAKAKEFRGPRRPLSRAARAARRLTWNCGTVVKLAQGIYEDRRFEDLPILADALEEAGCQEQSVLDHLRGPGPNVRGCWPLDLILGRA
jgi:hypothetical protein